MNQRKQSNNTFSRRDVFGIGALTALGWGMGENATAEIKPGGESLKQRLAQLEDEYNGEFAVEVNRLDGDGRFMLRSDAVLPTASTCKLFVLCELFRQAEAGMIDLNEQMTWKQEHHRGGDGILRAMMPGQKLSIHNMAVLMMALSDNIATAALIERVGAANVTRTMHSWGLNTSNLYDGLPGGANARQMKQPVSTAGDLCSLITRIYRREVLIPKSCDEIIRILRAQRCNDMLSRYIPVGEDWGDAKNWIANKTGYGACRVEVGIVKGDSVTFSLAMFFKPHKPPRHGLKSVSDYPPVLAMAHACKAVYDSFTTLKDPSGRKS